VDTEEYTGQPEQEAVGDVVIIWRAETGDVTLEAIGSPVVGLSLNVEGDEQPTRVPVGQILELDQAVRPQDVEGEGVSPAAPAAPAGCSVVKCTKNSDGTVDCTCVNPECPQRSRCALQYRGVEGRGVQVRCICLREEDGGRGSGDIII
jgi:hypothetical protein